MKQYLLSIYQPDGPPPADLDLKRIMRDVHALRDDMKRAGAWVFSGGLHDASTATVVRVNDGEPLITDGPYTEGKEHLGGFTIIKAADLSGPRGWARPHARAITKERNPSGDSRSSRLPIWTARPAGAATSPRCSRRWPAKCGPST